MTASNGQCKSFTGCIPTVPPISTLNCSLLSATDLPRQQLAAFNGIFFKDFITTTSKTLAAGGKSYGPIAVLRNVNAPGYHFSEQSNLTACVASDLGFEDYGLIVQGNITSTLNPTVRGNAYLYGDGQVTPEGTSCTSKNGAQSTFDTNVTNPYQYISYYLSTLKPNLRIQTYNILSSIGPQSDPAYNVITLDTCRGVGGGCPDVPFNTEVTSNVYAHPQALAANISLLSDGRGLISQYYGYTGLSSSGIGWPTGATLVINVNTISIPEIHAFLISNWFNGFF
jgi:hypothetical protein